MKRILILVCSLALLAGCTSSKTASVSSEGSTDKSSSASSMKVQDGYLEYQDENGNWQKLISIDSLKGKDGTNGTNGINGINGANGTAGAPGASGAPGAAGNSGAAGKDGSNVSINSDGELCINGIGTGYLLTKKEISLSIPASSASEKQIKNWLNQNHLYISYDSTTEYKYSTTGKNYTEVYINGKLVSGTTVNASLTNPIILQIICYDYWPTATPTIPPTSTPTLAPTAAPTAAPTVTPTATPTATPAATPTIASTATPAVTPEG